MAGSLTCTRHPFVVAVLVMASALAGCRPDRCRGAAPAFQLDVVLPAGVDGSTVVKLTLDLVAAGHRRQETIPITGALGDGQASIAVDVRSAGASSGFTVDVVVEAHNAGGHLIVRGQASFVGSGDACNFFRLELSGARDGGVDAHDARAELPCRTNADCVDTFACTEDTCTSAGCTHVPVSGQCFVGGACYAPGEVDPSNPCRHCDPAAAQLSFTDFLGKGCVTTVAGSGGGGFADGPVATALLLSPSSAVVDPSGNVYVADTSNSCIRKVSAGVVSTVAGVPKQSGLKDGPGAAALFANPSDLVLSSLDGLVVADYGNSTIRRVDPSTLAVSTLVGDGTSGFADGPASSARLAIPSQMAPGPAGIYLADSGNQRIRLISSDNDRTVSTVAGSGATGFKDGPAASAEFHLPQGVAVLDAATILVADTENHRIRQIRTESSVTTVTTLAGGEKDFKDGPGDQARFSSPCSLATGSGTPSSFVLYVADRNNHAIRKVSVVAGSVTVSTVAGGKAGYRDGLASLAQFNMPEGVAMDSAGRIYVADAGNHRIRLLNP